MDALWQDTYKGYGIVPASSWSTQQPFTAAFTITKPIPSGGGEPTHEVIHEGTVEGTFPTEQAAWDAARAAARSYINDLPALT
jgi:hypothetical protein